MPLYLVRPGSNGEFEQRFIDEGVIYFDWPKVVTDTSTPENLFRYIVHLYASTTGEDSDGSSGEKNHEYQAIQFAERMKPGDWIVMPSKYNLTLHFGKIKSDYQFHSEGKKLFQHRRIVEWFATNIPRDRFAPDVLDLIENFHTINQIQSNNAEARIKEMAENNWHVPKHSPATLHDSPAVASLNDSSTTDATKKASDVLFRLILARCKSEGKVGDLTRAILQAKRDNYRIFHTVRGEGKVINIERKIPYQATVKWDSGGTAYHLPLKEVENFKSLNEAIHWKERDQKDQEIKDRLKNFKGLMKKAFAWTLRDRVLIDQLSPDTYDRDLVDVWLKDPNEKSERPRLTSARLAEKAATQFFESYDKSVTDVAIAQVTGGTDDWKRFDLDVEGTPVDVKNARRSERNETRYVSQCVPKFKKKVRQTSQEVQIAGVVSHWQNLNEMENPEPGRKAVLILGVTQLSEINTIQNLFLASPLELNLREGLDGPTFLPPWIYNYPNYCYGARDQALQEIRAFTLNQEVLEPLKPFNPMPILAAANHPQIENLKVDLCSRQSEFLDRLLHRLQKTGLSLPIIFLTVLEEFLLILREGGDEQFEECEYERLLFRNGELEWPLCVYDPLKTVHTLLKTLRTLWEVRVGGLDQMTSFHLHNLNVLSGKSEQHDRWQTILAYCGGWISGENGLSKPCGETPLVMGECENCPACGKLICTNCEFCKKGCSSSIYMEAE